MVALPIGGGDLAEIGQQSPGGNRADASDRLQHDGALAQGRIRLHHAVELSIHLGKLVFDECDYGANAGVQYHRAFLEAILLARQLFAQLGSPIQPRGQRGLLWCRRRCWQRAFFAGKSQQNGRVEWIGLGALALRTGKGAHAGRIDQAHRHPVLMQERQ